MAKKPIKKPRPATRKRVVRKSRRQEEPQIALPVAPVVNEVVAQPTSDYLIAFYLLVGFLTTAAGVLFLKNFRILLMGNYLVQYPLLPYEVMAAGFVVLFLTFRSQSSVPPLPELSRPVAYLGFAFFYFLCFYTRFSHPEVPQASFWNDDRVVYYDIRAIIDWGVNHLLFPFGEREPFFPYFTAFLWKLIPNADGVYIDRLSSMLIDMGTCWGFYRLGKEINSRWLGLFLMAFYSVGKPMVIYCFFGYGANTCMLSTVWMTYFFFHLTKKPEFKRFIYLGFAMGFGAFTYVPARPWTPYLIGVTWLWVLWNTRQKPKSRDLWVLLTLGMAFCAFLTVYKNGYIPDTLALVAFFIKTPVWATILVVLLFFYFKIAAQSGKDESARLTFGWATMAMVALIINIPFYLQKYYSSHIVESSVLHEGGKMSLGLDALTKLATNVYYYFSMMFGQSVFSGGTYPINFDSFYDPLPVICMIVGLAFFLAKPSWSRMFILSLVPIGMVPFVLAFAPNSARPLTSVIPLLTLAGWGMVYWFSAFRAAVPPKTLRFLALAGFFALWAWNGVKSDWSIWHRWMVRVSGDQFIFQQVDKDWKNYRLFVAANNDSFGSESFTTLCDQREVYLWAGPTPYYLEPGEKGKDICLLFWGNDPRKIGDEIQKEYPQAQISVVPGYHEEDLNFLKRAVIPFSAIQDKPTGMVYTVQAPAGEWHRQFYCEGYGWARGMMWWDDRVAVMNAPIPKAATLCQAATAQGKFNAPVDGDYEFSATNAQDFIILQVDGKEIINHYSVPGKDVFSRAKIHLSPGDHSIMEKTYFQYNIEFPKIAVHPPMAAVFTLGE